MALSLRIVVRLEWGKEGRCRGQREANTQAKPGCLAPQTRPLPPGGASPTHWLGHSLADTFVPPHPSTPRLPRSGAWSSLCGPRQGLPGSSRACRCAEAASATLGWRRQVCALRETHREGEGTRWRAGRWPERGSAPAALLLGLAVLSSPHRPPPHPCLRGCS